MTEDEIWPSIGMGKMEPRNGLHIREYEIRIQPNPEPDKPVPMIIVCYFYNGINADTIYDSQVDNCYITCRSFRILGDQLENVLVVGRNLKRSLAPIELSPEYTREVIQHVKETIRQVLQ